ncbi:set domain-containing protein 4 [Citrus sinensis]|uniref:fructose-bisphosphate aldolase-lysine N-methyltransferase, chloroplastic isoform X2 n=1 Tax=Citrus sinensis TaxID=2711 RepID=UPI0003D71175|nr:fructose-bisphosphate aldolase-lysine N-methyltransferase, chloroplastic isoform X2 [Citrus sinensis]XP_024041204.1 fructose-bisphosphate aldolase-lysine N-methyltransferase, chloroplastic isoform X2 [Citrus x clementina]KAH9703336.1 set domain-containing protein 4 [Citrus sinensis]
MLVGARLTGAWCFRHRRPHCAKAKLTFSSSSESKVLHSIDDEYDGDFLPWLERKAGVEILSVLSIGKSVYGRSLFASEKLRTGDCILKVPYAAQLTPDNLHPKIKSLLDDEISNVAKLAIVILFEQKMGKDSEWAPYISRLPQLEEMHNTIFWSKDELDLICPSSLFEETVTKKDQIESEFLVTKPALECFPEVFDHIKLKDFMHAYALVESRAWRSTKGESLIPFADFLNHDGLSEAVVLHDEDKQLSEVIADRDYAPKEEVWITYGKFSNSTLLLDFGFSLPYNSHDEVQIQIKVPDHDPLLEVKLEVLQSHCLPRARDVNGFKSSNDSFTIKEVRSARGRGKGLPQSLRAFARVLCCTSPQELCDLATEAAQNDGRLARRPFRNSCQEILAHQILLSHIIQLTKEYSASIELLEPVTSPSICKRLAFRKQMARDLLIGELRILKSASAWLENYCATLA